MQNKNSVTTDLYAVDPSGSVVKGVLCCSSLVGMRV
jgi:hypothetical protein